MNNIKFTPNNQNGSYSIHFGLSSATDAYSDPVPAYQFNADPDPDFYLMRMRIQGPKIMRIHADPDPQH